MPCQWIKVICWKAAEGACKGFPCIGLPYMSITAIFRFPDCVALGIDPVPLSWDHYHYRIFGFIPSFFTGDGIASVPGLPSAWPTSISEGIDEAIGEGGGDIVLPFSCLNNWDKSLSPASSSAFLNKTHPSTIALWPSNIILWPATTALVTIKKKYIQLNVFDILFYRHIHKLYTLFDKFDIPFTKLSLHLLPLFINPLHLLVLL